MSLLSVIYFSVFFSQNTRVLLLCFLVCARVREATVSFAPIYIKYIIQVDSEWLWYIMVSALCTAHTHAHTDTHTHPKHICAREHFRFKFARRVRHRIAHRYIIIYYYYRLRFLYYIYTYTCTDICNPEYKSQRVRRYTLRRRRRRQMG